jgi:hypothetical protein
MRPFVRLKCKWKANIKMECYQSAMEGPHYINNLRMYMTGCKFTKKKKMHA